MAFITCTFRSEVLKMDTTIHAVIPDNLKEDIPVVYLLHGLNGDHTAWQRHSRSEKYAVERGLALIMPDAARSFYTDMKFGPDYYTYVSREVVDVSRKLFRVSDKREKNFIAGLSMGGYGAYKIALSNPGQYAAAASMSGCLDIRVRAASNLDKDTYLIWGNEGPADSDDLFDLTKKIEADGAPKPRLRQFCGTDDFLYSQNIKFRDFIKDRGFDYLYSECPGGHVWPLWDKWLPEAFDFFIGK